MKAPTYNELQRALRLAVNMLAHHEPGDSRLVSDEFVALAAVSCEEVTPAVMAVINAQIRVDKPAPAFYAEWTPKPKKEASQCADLKR